MELLKTSWLKKEYVIIDFLYNLNRKKIFLKIFQIKIWLEKDYVFRDFKLFWLEKYNDFRDFKEILYGKRLCY